MIALTLKKEHIYCFKKYTKRFYFFCIYFTTSTQVGTIFFLYFGTSSLSYFRVAQFVLGFTESLYYSHSHKEIFWSKLFHKGHTLAPLKH